MKIYHTKFLMVYNSEHNSKVRVEINTLQLKVHTESSSNVITLTLVLSFTSESYITSRLL